MTDLPSAPPSHRHAPEAPGLTAVLRHEDGWQALSITDSPQVMDLVLRNRTPLPLQTGPALVRIAFRPGVLDVLDRIELAPESEAGWALAVQETPDGVTLALSGVTRPVVDPGSALTIRLEGLSAAAEGGSRASRVALDYEGFFHADGREVAGSRLLHLPILRRHAPIGVPARDLRTGSMAEAGPFVAGFVSGQGVLNDGLSTNELTLRITNASREPVELAHLGDMATRFRLSFRTGTRDSPWGLIAADGDHLAIEDVSGGWTFDHHTIHRLSRGVWAPRETLEIKLRIQSQAMAGVEQLIVTFENLPGHDDGDLVLLVNLGSMAERQDRVDMIRPLTMRGEAAALVFEPGDVHGRGEAEDLPRPSLRVSEAEDSLGRLDLSAPAGLHLDGLLADLHAPARTPQRFHVAGRKDRFYPVVFVDENWTRGAMRFQVFRHHTHTDHDWHGSMHAEIACHAPGWGHGSDFLQVRARQSAAHNSGQRIGSIGYRRFVGGIATHIYKRAVIVFLAGNASYDWIADQPASLGNRDYLDAPSDTFTYGENRAAQSFDVKTKPDAGFEGPYINVETSMGQDTAPIPRGTVVMWWGAANQIPLGWALCDGKDGRPDLIDRFVMGAGTGNDGDKGNADTHHHSIAQRTLWTTSDGAHNHKFPSNWYKRNLGGNANYSAIDTGGSNVKYQSVQSGGEHRHKVTIPTLTTSAEGANRPKWIALCFIVKL